MNKNRHKGKDYTSDEILDILYENTSVVSATDCTGLMYAPPTSEYEVESYKEIYDIPQPVEEVNNGLQDIDKKDNRPGKS
ncbi:MAG TPA: hypothetical protein GXX17_08400 [Clostridiales bacterium]|nr:hypothetical protein [Clostridiales bacterium]